MNAIDCNCEWCRFYEDGCTLENVQIEAQVVTPMGFVPMCNSFEERGGEIENIND